MAKVFISYSRRDIRTADLVVERLEASGHDVWIDREGIDGGAHWRESIVAAIKGADAFVLMLTAASVQSDNVRRELDIAQDAAARLLPVQFGPADIPDTLSYQLAGIQIIDMSQDRADGFRRLLAGLGAPERPPEKHSRPDRSHDRADESADLSGLGGGGLFNGWLGGLFGRR